MVLLDFRAGAGCRKGGEVRLDGLRNTVSQSETSYSAIQSKERYRSSYSIRHTRRVTNLFRPLPEVRASTLHLDLGSPSGVVPGVTVLLQAKDTREGGDW